MFPKLALSVGLSVGAVAVNALLVSSIVIFEIKPPTLLKKISRRFSEEHRRYLRTVAPILVAFFVTGTGILLTISLVKGF